MASDRCQDGAQAAEEWLLAADPGFDWAQAHAVEIVLRNLRHETPATRLEQYNVFIFRLFSVHCNSLYDLNSLACVAKPCLAGTLPETLKRARQTDPRCRFFTAGICNILHAGTVGERQLRGFHHTETRLHSLNLPLSPPMISGKRQKLFRSDALAFVHS